MSLKEKYLSTRSGSLGAVEVQGWGLVRLRSLSLAELEEVQSIEATDPTKGLVRMFSLSVCDEQGNRVFGDEDSQSVKSLPAETLKLVCEAVAKHLSREGKDDAKKD